MSEPKKKHRIFIIILLCGAVLLISVLSIFPFLYLKPADYYLLWEIVPLFGLPTIYHSILIYYIFPLGLTTCMIFIPKLIVRLYFRTKRGDNETVWYVSPDRDLLSPKTYFVRAFYIYLLTIGLALIIIDIVGGVPFVPPSAVASLGTNPEYNLSLMIMLECFLLPLVFAFWSIYWGYKDAGLVNYDILKKRNDVYNVRPKAETLRQLLLVFGGIGLITYYIAGIAIAISGTFWINIVGSILALPLMLFFIAPAYILYVRFGVPNIKKMAGDVPLKNLDEKEA